MKCLMASSFPVATRKEFMVTIRQGICVIVEIWRTPSKVKLVVLPIFILQSLTLCHTVRENAIGAYFFYNLSFLSLTCLPLFVSMFSFSTDHRNVLSTWECLGVGTSHKKYLFPLRYHDIFMIFPPFLLAYYVFPNFLFILTTYLIANVCFS